MNKYISYIKAEETIKLQVQNYIKVDKHFHKMLAHNIK